ncbi:MAG: MAPEG family protein [Nevskia sp.]|nr:MAPEG family protein [Nevskia sp.]
MTVTPLYAGALALWFLLLSLRVVRGRVGPGNPSLGDGGNPRMQRLIRGQGNFAEYVPLILVLIGLLEQNGAPHWLLHGLGATLLLGRLLHGYALSFTQESVFGRSAGIALTFVALLASGVLCLLRGLHGL